VCVVETTAPRRRGLGPGRIEKQGGRWFAIWTDARGHRHRRVLSSDREVAERAFRKIVRDRDLELAGLGNEAGQERQLAEIVALYKADLATHRRPRYVDAVSYTLDKFVAEIGDGARVKDATVSRILLYRTKRLAAGASNRTCNADTGTIRACMNWAQSSGYIGTNPIAHLRPLPQTEDTQVKRRRALTEDEIDRLLNAATAEDADRADRFAATRTIASGVLGGAYEKRPRLKPIPQAPFWKFLVVTGLRFGEAASLRWSDFDEAEGAVTGGLLRRSRVHGGTTSPRGWRRACQSHWRYQSRTSRITRCTILGGPITVMALLSGSSE
jgi:integrase